MRRVLVGTAGHIDHGKTALVKALTGIDADRLPEEKRRGITIDLGFAHAEWEGVRVSFVDVPGHERFVRNMLAGAGGIQGVLLVVAADESVMPQTREHFEIVRLLGIKRGVVAVTKTDRVAADLIEVTVSDVRDLTRGSFLEEAPIVPVSSQTGQGLERLKEALCALAPAEGASEAVDRGVRLPIDRAFSISGFGPVVTGSLVSGAISRDQKLELLPGRAPVRVRRLEVHGRETAQARAGERVSANLAGIELSDLRRGLMLATHGAFATSALLTARIELLSGARAVKSGDRLSFHHFSTQTRARLRLLDAETLLPGRTARAQLRLEEAVAAAPADRFVLRRLSPVETVGGGIVLDPLAAVFSRRRVGETRATLDRLEGPLSEKLLLWIEQARETGAGEETLAARGGVGRAELRAALSEAIASGRVLPLRRGPDRFVAREVLDRLADRALREIRQYLAGTSGAVGIPRGTLLTRLLPGDDPRWAEAVEAALVARGVFAVFGQEARPLGREDLVGGERELSERIAETFRRRGLDPPSVLEIAREVGHKPKVVEGLAGYLTKKGSLLRLPGGWLVAREAVEQVIARLRDCDLPSLGVGEFKEMFGLTRRLAIPLLEYLDAARVTRRVGDSREILPSERPR
ncbi:MAG TPA: selenocysteine-specific translation elongation factor [Thermoanaerobaculia bacterium]|nr:selenocysteine-specific translation elongation factor [Thermoanaerobaculia bacterium]